MTLYADVFSGDVDSDLFRSSLDLTESDITHLNGFLPFNKTSPTLFSSDTKFPVSPNIITTNDTILPVSLAPTEHDAVYSNIGINTLDKIPVGSFGLFGELEQYNELWIARYLNLYYLWVILIFGFSGNIASFMTVIKIRPHRSYTICIALLAIVNNCAILSKLLFHQLTLYDAPIGPWGCRILYYLGSFFAMYSSWIIVTITVERFIAIYFPIETATICTRGKLWLFLTILAVLLLLADVHFLWTATDTFHPIYREHCGFLREYQHFIQFYWYWTDGCLYAIIPCIMLFILNPVNIYGIRKANRTQKEFLKNRSELIVEKSRHQGQITLMVVAISVLFLLLVLPNCVLYILRPTWQYVPLSREHALFLLIREISFVLSDSNHGIHFFIYFMIAKPFRRKFLDLLFGRGRHKRRNSSYCYMVPASKPFANVKLLSVSTIDVLNRSDVSY